MDSELQCYLSSFKVLEYQQPSFVAVVSMDGELHCYLYMYDKQSKR